MVDISSKKTYTHKKCMVEVAVISKYQRTILKATRTFRIAVLLLKTNIIDKLAKSSINKIHMKKIR